MVGDEGLDQSTELIGFWSLVLVSYFVPKAATRSTSYK